MYRTMLTLLVLAVLGILAEPRTVWLRGEDATPPLSERIETRRSHSSSTSSSLVVGTATSSPEIVRRDERITAWSCPLGTSVRGQVVCTTNSVSTGIVTRVEPATGGLSQ